MDTSAAADLLASPSGNALTTLECAQLVDRSCTDRVLVHGSMPGLGRDLDLLARPESEASIRDALLHSGFVAEGLRLVRFRRGSAEQVELFPSGHWNLPLDEIAAVFAQAVPIAGFANLARPSPAHTLLILARRVVEGSGRLDDKRRGYIEWAVDADPDAWQKAADRAEVWQGGRALELLERLGGHGFVSVAQRAQIIDERLRRTGRPSFQAHLETARVLVPRRPKPVVVAISGLDGSGKSTQARMLVNTLERIGVPSAMEWAKLGQDRRLWVIRRSGKRLLSMVLRLPAAPEEVSNQRHDAARERREASSFLSNAWASVTVISNLRTLRHQVRRYKGHAQVLVYDRYTLDSSVHLRWRYGAHGSVATGLNWYLRRFAPKPICSYLLRVPPEVAHARKYEDAIGELQMHASLYDDALAGQFQGSVKALDGTRPIHDLAAQIAQEVWTELARRPRPHRVLARMAGLVRRTY